MGWCLHYTVMVFLSTVHLLTLLIRLKTLHIDVCGVGRNYVSNSAALSLVSLPAPMLQARPRFSHILCRLPHRVQCCTWYSTTPESARAQASAEEVGDANATSPTHENASSDNYSPLLADPKKKRVIDKMLRVDHAGEIGARQIYAGQLAVFRGSSVGQVIAEMAEQELKHLNAFEKLMVQRRVRPTVMLPIWNVAGYALGLGTALLGKEAAMACTVAVEEVIAEHYNDQVRTLLEDGWQHEEHLRAIFREFRDDELEHKDTGIAFEAEKAPMYRPLSAAIKAACRVAIATTERI